MYESILSKFFHKILNEDDRVFNEYLIEISYLYYFFLTNFKYKILLKTKSTSTLNINFFIWLK